MQTQQIDFLALLNGQYQYVVPRWQRRYRWGQTDIGRLVDDLVTIAAAGPEAAHYGGTLVTFQEPGAAGVVSTIRVVDGQQRLTTVSILLACIADELGPDGRCADWTAQIIRDDRLTNPGKPAAKLRKLRLQGIDRVYDEFRRWAVRGGRSDDRPALCRDLARLAQLYGIVTGSAGAHRDAAGAERELRHLRAMEIDIHRPLTLRLLDDAAQHGQAADEDLAKVLAGIGTCGLDREERTR